MNTEFAASFRYAEPLSGGGTLPHPLRFGQEGKTEYVTLKESTGADVVLLATNSDDEPAKPLNASKQKKGLGPAGCLTLIGAGMMVLVSSIFCRIAPVVTRSIINAPARAADCVEITAQTMRTDEGQLLGKMFMNGTADTADIYESGNIYSCITDVKFGHLEEKDGAVHVYQDFPITVRAGHADSEGNIYQRIPGTDIRIGRVIEQGNQYQIVTNAGTVVGTIEKSTNGKELSKAQAGAAGLLAIAQETIKDSD